MNKEVKQVIYRNLWKENPIVRQILGICSSLAVTNLVINSLVMGVGVIFTLSLSSLTIALMRNLIPSRIRMVAYTLIIASYVILVDIFIKANLPDISKALGPYVGLIITNCIIMGRAEAFAQKNKPVLSMLDGFFSGLGYTIVLVIIAVIRESLGFGTILGFNINFINMELWTIMITPAAAFFIIGVLIWISTNYMNKRDLKHKEKGAA
jgi:Na+-transporting NADH:ubiquinone oxidoreductase subunit D